MATETRRGFAFGNPDVAANNGFGAVVTPDELRWVYAFGSPLIAPDGQTITDPSLQWYLDNAIGGIQRDLNYWFYPTVIKHRPPHGETRDDILPIDAFSLKYAPGGGSGTAATVTVASGVLSTTITGQSGDDLSLTLADYYSIAKLIQAINEATTTGSYTITLLGKALVTPTQLVDLTATDIFNTTATLQATMEEDVDFLYEDPYDYDVVQFQKYMYVRTRKAPLLDVTKLELRDPLGGVVMDLSNDVKIDHEKGSLEVFPRYGTLMNYPLLISPHPYTVASLRILWADRFPDGFFIDYKSGFRSAKSMRIKHPELFEVVGKLAAINLLADYGDGRTAAIASSSVGLSGLSESISTTLSATSAMYGARLKQWYEDLKFWYDRNRNKYAGVHLAAV